MRTDDRRAHTYVRRVGDRRRHRRELLQPSVIGRLRRVEEDYCGAIGDPAHFLGARDIAPDCLDGSVALSSAS